MEKFDGHDYTERSALEELLLIERHCRDGSAIKAGCACIEEKHLLTLAGLSSEMPTLAKFDGEKEYYMELAAWARQKREEILDGHFKGEGAGKAHDPKGEDAAPPTDKKLKRCIKEAEISCCGKETSDYEGCSCNPEAVCQASIEH